MFHKCYSIWSSPQPVRWELLFQILRWGNELEELKESEKESIRGTKSILPNNSNWIAIWQWGNFSLRMYLWIFNCVHKTKNRLFHFSLNLNYLVFKKPIWSTLCILIFEFDLILVSWFMCVLIFCFNELTFSSKCENEIHNNR